MAMNTGTRNGDVIPEMNTTPLIDVMLVLLTLLIVTLPLQTHAVKIDLPHGAPPAAPPPQIETIGVDFDGAITWNGQRVDRATLDSYLATAARQDPQPELHVQPDRLAKYDTIAIVLADAQRGGLRPLAFSPHGVMARSRRTARSGPPIFCLSRSEKLVHPDALSWVMTPCEEVHTRR